MAQSTTQKPTHNYSDLKALFINCTLKKSPRLSHTEGLMKVSKEIMKNNNVTVNSIRAVDYDIANGIYPDMTEHGRSKDDRPKIYQQIMNHDILVIGSPIWLGQKSSVCQRIIERLYGQSGELNENGQYAYYGRIGGCIITGNEDGIKHCSMSILYALQHLGFTIPPQADSGRVGAAGPGPSYLDEDSGGPQNDFTQRNTTFMTRNLLHMARLIKNNGGIPAYGNQRSARDAGCTFDHPNPEYR